VCKKPCLCVCFRQINKVKRPRFYKLKDVMDLVLNPNDSDFGDSSSDDEDDVENSGDVNAGESNSKLESDPEDNEPLSKLVTAQVPAMTARNKVAKKVYLWTKQTSVSPDVTFSGETPQPPDEFASPLHYLRQFVSDEMLAAVTVNTNLYSVQDGKSDEIDVKEVEKVIGVYLQMGL